MTHPWPLFGLRVWTERLELRLPTEDELVDLAEVALAGIHGPDEMPFGFPWTDQPSPQFERSFMQYHWSTRASWSPEKWELGLGVWAHGELVGTQGIGATNFAILRTVGTGSWLGREFQGQGIGKEMRTAVLALAFDHLGADWATSGAFTDNPASAAVSRALGYEENGFDREAPRGEPKEVVRFVMTAEMWRSRERPHVEVAGLDECRELFGV
jgi:RimJ/RimL family protein N-acetyltransferase